MKLKITAYLENHPFQKVIAKWWMKKGYPMPEKIKRQIINQVHTEMITSLMEVIARDGSIDMEKAHKVHYELGREVAPEICDMLSLDANDARSLSKIVDFINLLLDIKGVEVISDKDTLIRHEKKCFLSEQLRLRNAPYYCHLYQSMYKGVLHALNPQATANDLVKTQSMGFDHCELITTISKGI